MPKKEKQESKQMSERALEHIAASKNVYDNWNKNDLNQLAMATVTAHGINIIPQVEYNLDPNELGLCETSIYLNTGVVRLDGFILNASLKNYSPEYAALSAEHESFHAKSNGLITDALEIGEINYISMEDTANEISSIFVFQQNGYDLIASYNNHLTKNLPLLKTLYPNEYGACENFKDFGLIFIE
jgi:hypothetical protein